MADPADLPGDAPLVNDPVLEAEVVRGLSIIGRIGRFLVSDVVVPTYSLGSAAGTSLTVNPPAFRATDVFSNGFLVGGAAGTVHADTGPLAAGSYDAAIMASGVDNEAFGTGLEVQLRNAANTANLASWDHVMYGNAQQATVIPWYTFGLEVLTDNERLRIVSRTLVGLAEGWAATIFLRIRA